MQESENHILVYEQLSTVCAENAMSKPPALTKSSLIDYAYTRLYVRKRRLDHLISHKDQGSWLVPQRVQASNNREKKSTPKIFKTPLSLLLALCSLLPSVRATPFVFHLQKQFFVQWRKKGIVPKTPMVSPGTVTDMFLGKTP